ncbi:phosphoenolpyruvate synthase [Candidatus Pacearchaeota archaeon]|nr:phosphoenolpyruvate synthase [Candidatus Pacearchaeota archaeon]
MFKLASIRGKEKKLARMRDENPLEVFKMKEKRGKAEFIKWFSELDKNSGAVAGGKGANLAEIYNLKIPVPPGFVVTAQAYDYFIREANLDIKIKALLSGLNYEDTKHLDETTKKIREMITNSKLPKEMEDEIVDAYSILGSDKEDLDSKVAHELLRGMNEPIFVAVRSSATTEDLAEASFAGQQDSFVNVKGNTDLIRNIKKCFASLFTSRAAYYRHKQGFKYEQASLAVVVQKMVDSDKSGVIFSKDPSCKKDHVLVEAVWGLGEGIVSGTITPDTYILSPNIEITSKKIGDKKIAITRDSAGSREIIKLNETRAKSQVLKDYEIKKLAETALKLEEHYGKPQDIEFAIEGSDVFIVQTRPITTLEKRYESYKELNGEIILSGIPASPGVGVGKVNIINDLEELHKISKGDVLVTKMTNPDMVVAMQKSAAIVTDEGGLTSHAAIVSREMGIPAVVGTQEATEKLKNGELITVDGFAGKVYKGKVSETIQEEILPVKVETRTKVKIICDLPSAADRASKTKLKKVGLTRIEGIIAESGKHPEYFLKNNRIKDYEEIIFRGIKGIAKHFEELWIRTSDIRSDEYHDLDGAPKEIEANPMLGLHGIRYSLKNPDIFLAELKALKRVADEGKKIGVLVPQVISVDELKETKKYIKQIGFDSAQIGVMIETPAAVQIIKELCEEKMDFISFGTNDLTQYLLAIDRGNEKVQYLYDEMNPAILYELEFVIRVCKRNNIETSICGQAGSRKEMVKFLVERGIDSITVNADKAAELTDYIAELEKTMVVGTDEEPRKYQPLEKENKKESKPKITAVQNGEEEKRIEKDIEIIEKEKKEYLNEHPEESFDEEPEFKNEGEVEEVSK